MNELILKLLGIQPFNGASMQSYQISFANAKSGFQGLIFILIAIALSFGIWWVYKREPEYCSLKKKRWMAFFRIMGVLILLLIISNPVLAVFVKGSVRGKVVVLVDDSKSMSRVDKYKKGEDKLIAAHVLDKLPLTEKDATKIPAAAEREIASTSRMDLVRAMLDNKNIGLLEKLQNEYDVELWSFSKGSESEMHRLGQDLSKLDATALKELKADGTVTELGNAIRSTLKRYKGQALSGIVAITDGGSNKGEDPALVANESNARIFPVGIGVPESQDVALTHIFMENKIFVDDIAPITLRLKQHGYNNEQAEVVVTADGVEVAKQKITLRELGEQTEVVYVRPKHPGHYTYKVEVQPLEHREEDIEPTNNYKSREVDVIDQKLKVLVMETDPRWEYRYLKNSLHRDKRVDAKFLLRVPDMAELAKPGTEYLKEFPNREELFKYHAIVFGNMPNDGFFTDHDFDNLRKFVLEEGGGIWFIAGKNNMPDAYRDSKLDVLIPVELESSIHAVTAEDEMTNPMTDPYRALLTVEGRSHSLTRLDTISGENSEEQNAALWDLVPEMYWFQRAIRPKLGAASLLVQGFGRGGPAARRDTPVPLMVVSQVGRGRVLYQGFADLWRMRYPLELGPDALERFHARVVQYLGMPKLLGRTARTEIYTDRDEYSVGDRVRVNARVLEKQTLDYSKADKLAAVATNMEDETIKVDFDLTPEPGAHGYFRAEFITTNSTGRFRVTIKDELDEGAHADFNVVIPQIEMENPDMRKDLLEGLAKTSAKGVVDEKTHVRMYYADQAGDIAKDINQAQKTTEERQESPLWSSPLLLLLFTFCMGMEWLLRKRSDLL